MECYTSYIIKDGKTVEKFTARSINVAENEAKKYIRDNNITNAEIWVEDTTDKYI